MWSQSTDVTDGQTDGQTDDMRWQYRALHYSASRGKSVVTCFLWDTVYVFSHVCLSVGISLKELGVKRRDVWNFAQGFKFKTDFSLSNERL